MATTNVITSKLLSLNTRDFLRGLALTVITAVVTTIYDAIKDGGFAAINWELVLQVGLSSGLGYLLMNLGTQQKIVVVNPSDRAIEKVKDGAPIEVAGETIGQKPSA